MSDDTADIGADHHHPHAHGRTHTHDHAHDLERDGRRAGTESPPKDGQVALDIGGDIGAVIALLDDDQEGTELPILALDDPAWDPSTHTGVWRRSLGTRSVVVAVYPELKRGRYRITVPAGRSAEFDVVGGRVTELDLTTVRD